MKRFCGREHNMESLEKGQRFFDALFLGHQSRGYVTTCGTGMIPVILSASESPFISHTLRSENCEPRLALYRISTTRRHNASSCPDSIRWTTVSSCCARFTSCDWHFSE
jgi:hypothetical protein